MAGPGEGEGEEEAEFAEEQDSLWVLTFGPATWTLHFMIAYAAAAVFCTKTSGDPGGFLAIRVGIGILTVAALGIIGWLGLRAWRQWDLLGDFDYTHPHARDEDRHEFLGHSAVLLCGLSAIGVVYVAMPILFVETCG